MRRRLRPDPHELHGTLTVGTPDCERGRRPTSSAPCGSPCSVGNPATPADEADVRLMVSTTDVRCRRRSLRRHAARPTRWAADYDGELQARVALRITDKDNTPTPGGPGAATTVDSRYSFTVPLHGDSGHDMIGSACRGRHDRGRAACRAIDQGGRRAIWELGQVEVLDGGPDGDVNTPAGDGCLPAPGNLRPVASTRRARSRAARSSRPPRRRPRSPGSCPSRAR